MSLLRLENVSKSFGNTVALQGVDLDVAAGELVVVLGPSGCGKTTLLRVVAGLEQPSIGRVHIAGHDVTDVPPGRRNVAMVFQAHSLFPHMSVAENIGFGLIVRDVARKEVAERVRDGAALVGCEHLLGRHPQGLSGGERQRVALTRALVREPDVLLLDEPFSNLDAKLRAEVRAELRRIHERVGTTTLHVTHDQAEALVLGDRVAVVREGVLQQVAAPAELWERPRNRFVAQFVGTPTMNVVPVDGPLRVDGLPAGRRIELGVRPEHVVVGAGGTPARVILHELAGSETYVHLDADGTEIVARVDSASRPAVGDEMRVSVHRDHVHLFDAESGERIEWR